jgi:hypothetical protein
MNAVFRKDYQIHKRVTLSCFLDEITDVIDRMFELVCIQDFEQLRLTDTNHNGVVE